MDEGLAMSDGNRDNNNVGTTKKDGSHMVFYGGLVKGMGSALKGISLFIGTPALVTLARERMIPLVNMQLGYMAALLCLFALAVHTPESFGEVFSLLWRWSRLATVVITSLLELRNDVFGRRSGDAHKVFDVALETEANNSEYAQYMAYLPKAKKPVSYYVQAVKRVCKIALFKMSATVIAWVVPNGQNVVLPLVRFATMRTVLGMPLAFAVASVYAIPQHLLHEYWIDDALVSFGEALVDADDLGTKLINPFLRKVEVDTRAYVTSRYRGYIIGLGFVFSLLSAVPFIGIPMSLVAEAGAACLVVDITRRNIDKRDRMELPGERMLAIGHDKES